MPPGIHDHGAPTRRGARSEMQQQSLLIARGGPWIGRAHRRGGRCGHAKSTVRCGVWRDAMIRLRVNARSCAGEFAYVVHSEHRQCRPVLCDCLSTCSDDLFEKRKSIDLLEARSRRRSSVRYRQRREQPEYHTADRPARARVVYSKPSQRAARARTAQSPHSFSSASIITTELPRMTTIPTLFCSLAETCGK